MIIAVDFDGTIVDHGYPDIGAPVPGAFEWLKKWQEQGAKLILWTMRSNDALMQAVEFCRTNGLEFYGVNESPTARLVPLDEATAHAGTSPKGGLLVRASKRVGDKDYVDWDIVGPAISKMLEDSYGV